MRPLAEQEVARLARGDDILAKFYEIRSAKFALGQIRARRLHINSGCCAEVTEFADLLLYKGRGSPMRNLLLATTAFGTLAVSAMAADLPPAAFYTAPIAVPVFHLDRLLCRRYGRRCVGQFE
jgi:hypothetical protein